MHKYQYIYSSHRTRRQGEYLDFSLFRMTNPERDIFLFPFASLDQKIYFCYRACVNVPQGAFRGGGSAGSSSSTRSSPSTTRYLCRLHCPHALDEVKQSALSHTCWVLWASPKQFKGALPWLGGFSQL